MEHQFVSTLVPIALAVEAAASTKKKKTEARPLPKKATNFACLDTSVKQHANAAVPFLKNPFNSFLHHLSVAVRAHAYPNELARRSSIEVTGNS